MDKKMKVKYAVIYIFCLVVGLGMGIEYPIGLQIFVFSIITEIMIAKVKYHNNLAKYYMYSFLWGIISTVILIGTFFIVATFKLEAIRKIILFQLFK